MALPVLPLALAGAAALWALSQGKKDSGYSQAPADGSTPAVKEPAAPAKTWKEMPPALQEQVAAALGALGVSPATGELSGQPVSAEAIQMATQTAGLCESQGFYDVAKELRRLVAGAVVSVPTPAAAAPIKAAAPPGLSAAQMEALARTLTLDRDPKSIAAVLAMLEKLPPSPERDHLIAMAQAMLLQLASAQSTTQTLQQIDQVIKSPGIAEVHAAVQPLPPVAIPVSNPKIPEPEDYTLDYRPPPGVMPMPQIVQTVQQLSYAVLKPLTGSRLLKATLPMMTGEDVKAWQNILRLDGYTSSVTVDKVYGPKTVAATKDWQKKRGLVADGRVGPATRAKIGTGTLALPTAPAVVIQPTPASSSAPRLVFANVIDPTPKAMTLKQGSKDKAAVKSWQNILTALGLGSIVGTPDGDYGAKTVAATRALQTYAASRYKDSKPINVDGAVGPQTRRIVLARTAELKGTVIAGRAA